MEYVSDEIRAFQAVIADDAPTGDDCCVPLQEVMSKVDNICLGQVGVISKSRVPGKESKIEKTSGGRNDNYPDEDNYAGGYKLMTGEAVGELLQEMRSKRHDLREIPQYVPNIKEQSNNVAGC